MIRKPLNNLTFVALLLTGMTTALLADDLNPPGARGNAKSTMQEWHFPKGGTTGVPPDKVDNDYGDQLHASWVAQGMAAPQLMETASVEITATAVDDVPAYRNQMQGAAPNPFNPSTTLSFSVAQDGPVTIDIYDPRGRLARHLVGGVRMAGEHTAVWDGRDGRGRRLGSGVYFAVFQVGGTRASSRLMLVK